MRVGLIHWGHVPTRYNPHQVYNIMREREVENLHQNANHINKGMHKIYWEHQRKASSLFVGKKRFHMNREEPGKVMREGNFRASGHCFRKHS